MPPPVPVKVYAAFSPLEHDVLGEILAAAKTAIPTQYADDAPCAEQDGTLFRLAFEGLYFPLDEVLEALCKILPRDAEGKIDYLDMEAWTLTRHVWQDGEFCVSTRSLNHVLDYSGH